MIYKGKKYYPTFHTTNEPIARKAWKCTLCGEPIDIGKRYVRYTWRRTSEIDDLPFHPGCWSIVKFYCKQKNTNVFSAEAVNEWLKDRHHCKLCKNPVCHKSTCETILKYVKHKPLLTYYDKLKPMPEEPEKPDETYFKVLDESEEPN